MEVYLQFRIVNDLIFSRDAYRGLECLEVLNGLNVLAMLRIVKERIMPFRVLDEL
jgi:hypothetical protein